jgi:hypothetical protein
MGILETLFRKREEFPRLDPASAAAARIAARLRQLEPFVRKVRGRLELVPAAAALYVYLDKPPGAFGMAWFVDDREVSFTSLKEDQGLSQGRIRILSEKLGAAYLESAGAARYATTIAGKEVLVTPSDSLAAAIGQAIDEAAS